MIKSPFLKAVPVAIAVLSITEQVLACTMTPPMIVPPILPKGTGDPSYWVTGTNTPSGSSGMIFLQLNAVAGVNDTNPLDAGGTGGVAGSGDDSCACGISPTNLGLTSIDVTDASFGRGSISDIMTTFEEYSNQGQPVFDFTRNSDFDDNFASGNFPTADVIQGGSGSSNPDDWFAFTDLDGVPEFMADQDGIDGFELTDEQPYYFLKFNFTSNSPLETLLSQPNGQVQFAAGKLQTAVNSGSPGSGAIGYTNPTPLIPESVPEPTTTLSLLCLGLMGAGSALRRKS